MKKMCISFTIFMITLSLAINVFATENITYKKQKKAFEEALSVLLEPYKKEDIAENERIIDYAYNGFGLSEEDENHLSVNITFDVIPVMEDSDFWTNKGYNQICFAKFLVENGEYVLESVSLKPENYDKFLEGLEKYKEEKTNQNDISEVKKDDVKLDNIKKTIYIVSGAIMFVILLVIIKNKRR